MEQELINAYLNTSYNVFEPAVSIRIGRRNPELDALLKMYKIIEWAFVTAYNPFSEILNDEENEERHKQLHRRIEAFSYFEGEGVGTDPSWKPERSFLILGISEKDAGQVGAGFQQNAIVVGKRRCEARLILLR